VSVAAVSAGSDGTVWRPDDVRLVATVTLAGAPVTAGEVLFLAGGVPVAVDDDGADGWSTTISSLLLPEGAVELQARWAAGSESAASPSAVLTVVPGAEAAASRSPIQAALPVGTFLFSSPFGDTSDPNAPGSSPDNPFPLAETQLDPTGRCFVSVTPLPLMTLTDTRPGEQAFTLSAAASDLVNDAAGAALEPGESINAQNLGLVVTASEANYADASTILLPPGSPFSESANVSLVDNSPADCVPSAAAGTDGLGGGVAHPIVHVARATGTIRLSSVIVIAAPTSTRDGTYRGTVTFTFLGS